MLGAGPGQQRRTHDYGGEGCDTCHAERASGQGISEDEHARRDRERVRPQSRKAGGCQCAAALETQLQRDEGEPVAGEQRGNERRVESAGDGRLGADVTRGIQDTGGHPETRSAVEEAGCGPRCKPGERDRGKHPHRRVAKMRVLRRPHVAGQRDREQH